MPASVAAYIYTVIFRPKPLRLLVQWIICRMIPRELNLRGVTLVLNQKDAIVSGNLALGCYETENLDLFESLLEPGMCVVDIGANIGLYTAVAAQRVGPNGRVVAIEPGPENCAFIRQTVKRNAFSNVTVLQKAAGARAENAFLYLCATNKADHRIYDQAYDRERVPIEILPVDSILDSLGLNQVDVMKIDTQGAEPWVFDGMQRLLQTNQRIKIMMEFWPWGMRQAGRDPAELIKIIQGHNFTISEIHDDGRGRTVLNDPQSVLCLVLERQHTNLLLEHAT